MKIHTRVLLKMLILLIKSIYDSPNVNCALYFPVYKQVPERNFATKNCSAVPVYVPDPAKNFRTKSFYISENSPKIL